MTDPAPPATFPCQIGVFCDDCGVEVVYDYVVDESMTREQRLGVARAYLTRSEGWSCSAVGDFCPQHKSTSEPGIE